MQLFSEETGLQKLDINTPLNEREEEEENYCVIMWIICCCVKLNLNHLALFQYRVNPSFPSKSRFSRQFPSHGEGWGAAVFHQFRDTRESRKKELGRFVHPLQGRVSSSSTKIEPDPSFEPVSSFRASYHIRASGPRWKDERSRVSSSSRESVSTPFPWHSA